MYTRTLENFISNASSSFLFGPRQCGKTTLLKKLKPDLYIDLLRTDEYVRYLRRPSILYDEVQAGSAALSFIVIDEVQRVPHLLNEVQRIIEDFPKIKFVLSGSSARKLKRGGGNLLGGRFVDLSIFPLTSEELGTDFDLSKALSFGTLPKIYSLIVAKQERAAQQLLRSYISTYLAEEIRAEALVRKIDHFQRFLDVAGQQFAREVNQSELADQAQISLSSVKNYYSILEDTMIGFFLFPYSTSIRKQLTKTPKFYFFDNGVVRAIQGVLNTNPTNQERGLLFEQLMIQEAFRINKYLEKDLKLSFWRTVNGAEVDLIFSKANKIVLAVEFKSSAHPNLRDLSGLNSFAEEYPKVQRILCAPVEREFMLGGVKVVPPQEMFSLIRKV